MANNTASWLKTSKGKQLLKHEGYMYYVNKTTIGKRDGLVTKYCVCEELGCSFKCRVVNNIVVSSGDVLAHQQVHPPPTVCSKLNKDS